MSCIGLFSFGKICGWTNPTVWMGNWAMFVIHFGPRAGGNFLSVRNFGVCCANSVSKWQQQSNLPALVHRINWLYFHTGNENGATSFTCAMVEDEIRRDAESCSVYLKTYFEGLSTLNVFVEHSNSSNTAKITSITTEPSGNTSIISFFFCHSRYSSNVYCSNFSYKD